MLVRSRWKRPRPRQTTLVGTAHPRQQKHRVAPPTDWMIDLSRLGISSPLHRPAVMRWRTNWPSGFDLEVVAADVMENWKAAGQERPWIWPRRMRGSLKPGPVTDGRVRASVAGQYAHQMLSTISSTPDNGEAANGGARCSVGVRSSWAIPLLGDGPCIADPNQFRCEPPDPRPRCGSVARHGKLPEGAVPDGVWQWEAAGTRWTHLWGLGVGAPADCAYPLKKSFLALADDRYPLSTTRIPFWVVTAAQTSPQ